VYEFQVVRLFLMMLYTVLELHLLGLGQSLVVFLVVGLPLIVSASLGFQDLVFGDLTFYVLFIARGWLHSLLILCSLFFFLCSLTSLHFSSLVASLVALHFIYIPLKVWIVFSFTLFLVSNLSSDFSVVGFHSPSL
ncbi:hypothetical protein HID58_029144, partial [Brassica napus]